MLPVAPPGSAFALSLFFHPRFQIIFARDFKFLLWKATRYNMAGKYASALDPLNRLPTRIFLPRTGISLMILHCREKVNTCLDNHLFHVILVLKTYQRICPRHYDTGVVTSDVFV